MAGKEKLTARAAATTKPGRYGDGRGLYLVVSGTGSRKWVFRFTFGGRVTEMGLGNAAVSLFQAREKAAKARKLVAAGRNPIEARREAERSRRESRLSANARTLCLWQRLPNGATTSIGRNGQ
jgi:hypothetical protein